MNQPPHRSKPGGMLPPSPPCPFCDSRETELVNPFGGQLSVAQYWCRGCRTGFEYLKWGKIGPQSHGISPR